MVSVLEEHRHGLETGDVVLITEVEGMTQVCVCMYVCAYVCVCVCMCIRMSVLILFLAHSLSLTHTHR